MIIDYPYEDLKIFPNFKGGEKELQAKMFSDGRNRILKATLAPGASIGLHKHDTSSEIMYFLSGKGKVLIDGREEWVSADKCHYCPKGSQHSLINTGEEDLNFFAVVPEQ